VFVLLCVWAALAKIRIRVVNGNYDAGKVDVLFDSKVLFSAVPLLDDAGAVSNYTEMAFPAAGSMDISIRETGQTTVTDKKTLDKFVDGVWHTVMFAKRRDKFCASVAYDSGPSAPVALPAAPKSAALVYNVGCELGGLNSTVALTVLLNGVVVWPAVAAMSRGEPLQFASGTYAYDALLVVNGAPNALDAMPLLATAGNARRNAFAAHSLYRLYFARVGGRITAAIELVAGETRELPKDLPLDSSIADAAGSAGSWIREHPAETGLIAGGICLCICLCIALTVALTRRRRRRSRDDYEW